MDIDKLRQQGLEAQQKVQGSKQITGLIEKKLKKYNGKGPVGLIYINDIEFTCWTDIFFKEVSEGDLVQVSYTEKLNSWNGKLITNRNIVDIQLC